MDARNHFRLLTWTLIAALGLAASLAAQSTARPAPSSTQPQTTIITNVTMVDVPVLVLDHTGAPVIGLSKTSFRLLDNGQSQSLMSFDNQPRPITLAIVIDTSDPNAVAQAHRAAQVFAQMVVGSSGKAGIFIAGPEAKQVLPFTSDLNAIVDALHALKVGPRSDGIGEPLSMAVMALARQPRDNTRAVLVISRQSSKGNSFAQAITETSMNDATPIFQLAPNRPKNVSDVNPISPEQAGTGVGSNRSQIPPTVTTAGQFPPSPGSYANFNLGDAVASVIHSVHAHHWNYVQTTGGLSLHASNDGDFDRKLAQIGDALRSIYQLYYQPTNLSRQASLHHVEVQVQSPALGGTIAYRRAYLGYRAH